MSQNRIDFALPLIQLDPMHSGSSSKINSSHGSIAGQELLGYPSRPNTRQIGVGDCARILQVQEQNRSLGIHSLHLHQQKPQHARPICPGVPEKPPVQACPYIITQPPSALDMMSKWEEFSKHMKLGQGMSEALKGKLSLGAKIVTKGGKENYFKDVFPEQHQPDEKLVKTCSCYLSTTTGPVAGVLFISTHNLAFCSERSLLFFSPSGGSVRTHYLVCIPLKKVNTVNPCENAENHGEKYIRIITEDEHEFWFMGFVNFHKALKYMAQVCEAVRPQPQLN